MNTTLHIFRLLKVELGLNDMFRIPLCDTLVFQKTRHVLELKVVWGHI